jgi:hypothetical protein
MYFPLATTKEKPPPNSPTNAHLQTLCDRSIDRLQVVSCRNQTPKPTGQGARIDPLKSVNQSIGRHLNSVDRRSRTVDVQKLQNDCKSKPGGGGSSSRTATDEKRSEREDGRMDGH